MKETYYTLENGNLKKVGSVIRTAKGYVSNPIAEDCAAMVDADGKPNPAYPRSEESFAPPKCDEGYHAVPDGYDLKDGKWVRKWRIEKLPPPPPRIFSKLKIKIAIARLGKLAELEAYLATIEIAPNYTALAAWNDAQNLSENFDGFADIFAKIKAEFGISDEEGEKILSACVAD